MMADGTYKAILVKWGMEANAIPAPMINSKLID
jgi:ABC-type amino acid transport substrate-binding protein